MLLEEAREKNPNAQRLLGDLVLLGYPETVSGLQAIHWYRQAAPHLARTRQMAERLGQGQMDEAFALLPAWPLKEDKEESQTLPALPEREELMKKAEGGDGLAMVQLAILDLTPEGEVTESSKGWLSRAAEAGHVGGQILLAMELEPSDAPAALGWLRKAAATGSTYGRYRLANHLLSYQSESPEAVNEARSLLTALADSGSEPAKKRLEKIP
ncbi:MAG: sel1 repeat family protein [Magnetococcales bacterium]|nr:sel1 repeat family protein [Magnetococcales bacterium]